MREPFAFSRGSRDARRAVFRGLVGFALGLAIWIGFSTPYERLLAGAAETILRTGESPAVTRLGAKNGEIIVDRADFPPAAPRPGLPAADIHFDFVVLAALFAAARPFRPGRFLLGTAVLFALHVAALVCQVESLYATRLGPWSEAHYGVVARNVWASAFHVWQIAGRFAAPFAIWWGMAMGGDEKRADREGGARRRGKRDRI